MQTSEPRSVPSSERHLVQFPSGSSTCAAWHYPGRNGALVVMAAGFGVTKEPGTDRFARHFHSTGYSVLAFDFRHLGDSGGEPRQLVRVRDQLADWDAALAFAATLAEIDPARIAIWGFSLSAGHVLEVAAAHPELAAAIAQAPNADGRAAMRNAMRHTTKRALARVTARGIADTVGGWFGRAPRLIPLAGPPGSVALLTTPDAQDANHALNPGNAYPQWQQTVAARSALHAGSYRPGRVASRIECPLLVLAYDDDTSALPEPAIAAAARAPHGELAQFPGSHYAAFLEAHDATVAAEREFLQRHVLEPKQTP